MLQSWISISFSDQDTCSLSLPYQSRGWSVSIMSIRGSVLPYCIELAFPPLIELESKLRMGITQAAFLLFAD